MGLQVTQINNDHLFGWVKSKEGRKHHQTVGAAAAELFFFSLASPINCNFGKRFAIQAIPGNISGASLSISVLEHPVNEENWHVIFN